uniref:DNA-directed RNA polymerase n=1 Tax=Molossus molossus TaxID=27622 RepID=A0A7J8IAI6_MOLMO|nr:RNA polymerase mitochondrial [Molossus molossus]
MSALRWGRGAAGFGWALWPAGRPSLLAEEGALGGVWGCRRSSSASPCEQDRRRDWGHAELLEVLEARVRQLQGDNVSEVTAKLVDVARFPKAGGSQPPRKAQAGNESANLRLSGRWAQKLDKEKLEMQKRKQQLEAKLQQRAERRVRKQQLRVEPQLLSGHLADRLQCWEHSTPRSPWKEQLAQLLQEAPRRLSREEEHGLVDRASRLRCEGQQQKLLAFLECCVLVDQLPLAHHVLVMQHSKSRQQRMLTLPMYNIVLLGWARKGSFKELVYVFFMMRDAGLAPDLLSYAAALQCMGRLNQDASTIKRCLKQMAQDGLQLQDFFTSLPLCKEDRAALLRAVHKAEPTFIPLQPPLPSCQVNTSPLLREIYDKNHPVSYPRQHLPLKTLKDLFQQQLSVEMATTVTVDSVEKAPLLCPPLPWTSPHSGAFLLSPTKLMRSVEGTTQHQRLLESCPPTELHGALDALTQLGNCAWRVNGRVLDLVLTLFNAKGCPQLGVPAPASEAPRPPQCRLPTSASPERKAELRRELARCLKVAREMHSLRTDALYRLSLAQHLRHRIFWLPHNMDFRGRTYPCPPHFNHLGSDLARALLEFAQGRPLGPHGLDWLKIHLVNLTGLKKRESLQARLAFADEVMKDILDSADQPMMGRKWWMEADEPWQALACCMEIAQAVRAPNPAAYVSHFPVHQDGSCNGLQHYAALGRDSVGAASVNLVPSDVPQDVYSSVAAQVEVFRKQDAERGVQVAQVLEGFISRKVVKQTVMTVVYGVTRYGGRLQIEKRLRELSSFPQEFVWQASHYLVRQVFNSLQEMFSGTRAIQRWLAESARLIARTGLAVEWVTPLGIPIIQPYHHDSKVSINGGIQSLTFSNNGDTSQKPNTLKQKNGFPPNFIHSLDSSHMMLTALHCYRKGLTFVSVHDCFWTHAADVPIMNQVCREQFIRLHSQPILHDLSRFLVERFCSGPKSTNVRVTRLLDMLLSVPKTGTFNLEQVKHSTYFFS